MPTLIWGTLGAITGVLSFLAINIPTVGVNFGPGILFGIVIFLFGEFSSKPSLGRRKRVFTFPIIIVASTIGWWLAFQLGGGDTFSGIYEVLPLPRFLVAGIVGGTLIVLSELLCWRFTLPKWLYAICVISVAGFSGLFAPDVFELFVLWQTCVLIVHVVAFGVNKKQLIISTLGIILIAGSTSIAMTFKRNAERERVAKESAQQETEEARVALARVEADNKVLQESKEAAERRAEEERNARTTAAYIAQVSRQLDFAGGYYLNNGFSRTHDYKIEQLPHGQTASFTLNLATGWQYILISACDKDCSDIDIYVYDGNGNQIASDSSRDDRPVVNINVFRGGEFRVKVVMYKCNSSPCVYGIGAFGKGQTF